MQEMSLYNLDVECTTSGGYAKAPICIHNSNDQALLLNPEIVHVIVPKFFRYCWRILKRHLAESFPRLWSAETTTHAQRKEIVRQVIQKIVVNVKGENEQVQVNIVWNGGFVDQVIVIRPVAKWTQLSNYPQLCQRLVQMAEAQLPTDEMIKRLHQEGFHPPKRCKTFNSDVLRSLTRRLGLGTYRSSKPRNPLTENEWWLPDLAITLKMPEVTLYNWVRRGWVNARQQPESPKYWIVWADEAELERLRTH